MDGNAMPDTSIEKRTEALHQICRQHRVKRLDVFGSATTDQFSPLESDIDFLVEFESVSANSYRDLKESLATLFNRPLDLVSASAITNPYFRRSVEQSRVKLYES